MLQLPILCRKIIRTENHSPEYSRYRTKSHQVIDRFQNGERLNLSQNKINRKTSLIITLPEDHAGGVCIKFSVFAWRKMNLTKIESRTLKTGLGNYFFFFINVANEWHPVLSNNNALEELKSRYRSEISRSL